MYAISLRGIDFSRGEGYFLRSVEITLFDAYISECMRVFERNGQSATLWYLHRCNSGLIGKALKDQNKSLVTIEPIVDGLKHIRDNAHFHLDKKAVVDLDEIWKQAGIREHALQDAVDLAFSIVVYIQSTQGWPVAEMPPYSFKDALQAAERASA